MPASLSWPISSMISCRSTVFSAGPSSLRVGLFEGWAAQLVVAGAIGHRLDRQRQRRWGCDRRGRIGIALPRQDVEHNVAAEQSGCERLGTGRLDSVEPGLGNLRQDIDELAITVVMAGQPPPDLRQRRRQIPVAERIAVPQRAGLPGQHRQVMPGIVGGLAAAEAAGMLADNLALTPDDDAIGVDAQLRGAPRCLDRDAVAVVVEAHQAALRHRDLDLAKAVEGTAIRDQALPLGLEDIPHRLVALLGMRARARLRQTARLQPGVE